MQLKDLNFDTISRLVDRPVASVQTLKRRVGYEVQSEDEEDCTRMLKKTCLSSSETDTTMHNS